MKEYNIEMPNNEVSNIKRIVTKYGTAEKVYSGNDIITGASDIKLNHVKVDGDCLSCSNYITIGFLEIRDCSDKDGNKIGISLDFKEKTAQAVNYDNFYQLSFVKNNCKYNFTFTESEF